MAGDWIKMRTNLDTDPRICELSTALNLPNLYVVGCLWKLWAWADEHTIDGNAVRVTEVTLDRFTGVTGFAAELRKVGWLEGRDSALSFPRFAEHNGQTAKNRALTAKRVAEHKARKGNAETVSGALPREEKRREDINTGTTNVVLVGNELPTANGATKTKQEPESSGIVFAMRSGVYDLDERKLAGYVAAYRFDVRRELMKAALWLRDNPHRRPRAKSSMQAFITRWLNRHDDRAKPSEQLGGRIGKDPKLEAEMDRAARVRREKAEAIRNGKVPSIPTE